ncbi:MAG: XRE family transcriptional regulator [Clostridia bacterium]|nr:XRE family transcriptional regulator [Clostridia bacterium]
MKEINIAKIISAKRHEKGITQDQLASYIGVSKASVSKWETGQSYPDITFLPQLAAYFNLSIDDLIGYTPQRTKEDIKTLYHRLSADFSCKSFNYVLDECRNTIKEYYSCFPLLMQMAVLLCNHHMLAENPDERKQILNEVITLCDRIKSESDDVWLAKEAASLEATCYLMMGEPQAVLALLGETIRPFPNDDAAIAQAYISLGNLPQANKVLQISLYQHLLSLVGAAVSLLQLRNEQFEEAIQRVLSIVEIFHLESLHPNIVALTYLNAAQGYCLNEQDDQALVLLQKYTNLCISGFSDFSLHGDSFFSELDPWFKEFDLGGEAPRSKEVIKASMLQGIANNPAFARLQSNKQYQTLVNLLKTNAGEN